MAQVALGCSGVWVLLRVWLGLIGFARGILSAVLHGVAQGWSAASGLMLLLVMFECNAVLLLLLLMKSVLHTIQTQASPGV